MGGLSIKYHKKFAVWVQESNKQKLTDLLHRTKMETQIVRESEQLEQILTRNIDYTQCQDIIDYERIHSEKYLAKYIDI